MLVINFHSSVAGNCPQSFRNRYNIAVHPVGSTL
jgi:hypothetical protein